MFVQNSQLQGRAHKFNEFLTKIDNFLFGDNTEDEALHRHVFQSYLDSNSTLPATLLTYLHKEMRTGLIFNYILSVLLFTFIPAKFWECWICDSVMTTWILLLSFLNVLLVIPKHILLWKIHIIRKAQDTYGMSYLTWKFFRSRLYKANNRISKLIFVVYIVGSLLVWWSKLSNCLLFFAVSWALLLSFAARVMMASSTFSENIAGHQNAAVLLEYFSGATTEKIMSLKHATFEQHRKSKKHSLEQTCAICHEEYNLESKVRVMECPGEHAFHNTCIDRWLLKSEKCPLCNCSVFQNRTLKKD